MKIFFLIISVVSFNAFSTEECNFGKAEKIAGIEKYRPILSESEVLNIAQLYLNKQNKLVPENWCRSVSLSEKNSKLVWKVFFAGSKLDACYSIYIEDKTKVVNFEYCG
jgi:hypothetical protein